MKFEKGTPGYGLLIGILFAVAGFLVMFLGFWKTVVLLLLFAVGYFLGAVNDKQGFARNVANRVIPEKKNETINIRETLSREQESMMPGTRAAEDEDKGEEANEE